MSWPLSHEFNEAVQTPAAAFDDPDLKAGEVVVGATGLPLPRSGNFADVYQVCGADGKEWAVKCFTRPVVGLDERYARVGAALAKAGLPFTVGFKFLAEGILVGGAWRPVVKMEWVEGLLLNQVVRENAGKPVVLTALAQVWTRLCKRLRDAGIAHADVQHGNVLMVPGSRPGTFGLKLIDYDGMWVPALANTPSGESGHPSYQHPARIASRAYSPDLDRFPHLVVATALRGLAVGGQAMWDRYDNGDNLLFEQNDFKAPAASAVMKDLWKTDDPAVQALVGQLAVACGRPLPQTPWLDQIAPEGEPVKLTDAQRRDAAAALGVSLPVAVAPPPAPVPASEFADLDAQDDEPRLPRPARPQPARGRAPMYLAAAGVLVLVAGVGTALLVAGGKSPPETAQKEEKEPHEPPRPKDKTPHQPPAKDKVQPGPVTPTPPVTPVPPVPPDPMNNPPVQPVIAAPAGRMTTHELWKAPLPPSNAGYPPTISRDGSVVAANNGGKFFLFDAATGRPLPDPPANLFDNRIVGMADGKFGRARLGGPVPVWDARAGKVDRELQPGRLPFPSYAFVSPTGRFLAASPNGEADHLYVVRTNPTEGVFDTPWARGELLFADDETRALVSEGNGKNRWYDLRSGRPTESWANSRVTTPVQSLSGDGKVAALWVPGGRTPPGVIVVNALTGQELAFIVQPRQVTPSLSRDGRLLLVPTNTGAELIDLAAKGPVAVVPIPTGYTSISPVILPDGKGCVAVAGGGQERAVVRYDFRNAGAVAVALPNPPVQPVGAAVPGQRWFTAADWMYARFHFTADGKTVFGAATGPGGLVALDLATGNPRPDFTDFARGRGHYLAPFGAGKLGTWPFASRTVHVWDAATGRELGPVAVPDVPPPAAGKGHYPYVAVSPDGRVAASGFDRGSLDLEANLPLVLFDLASGRAVRELTWSGGAVHFTADGGRVLVAETAGRGRWFKLPAGEPDGTFDLGRPEVWKHEFLGMSADGGVLAYFGPLGRRGGHGPASLDGRTGEPVKVFPPGSNSNCRVCVSADGRRVAWTNSEARATGVYAADARTGTPLGRFTVAGPMAFPALSPDGSVLVVSTSEPNRGVYAFEFGGPGPVAVRPPDPAPPVVAPKQPAPPPPDLPELKVRWGPTQVKAKLDAATPVFDYDGKRVLLVGSAPVAAAAFDARTGVAGRELTTTPLKGRLHRVFQLEGGKVGFQTDADRELLVWDSAVGLPRPKPFTPPAGGGVPYLNISPSGRYLAVGTGGADPLRVTDTTANKTVTLDGPGGTAAFAADSSRLLVADAAGRFRWFRLPGGQPDGDGWPVGMADGPAPKLLAASADGGRVLFHGRPAGKELTVHLLDGKTGGVVHSFPPNRYAAAGWVSADGRRVALLRADDAGTPQGVEVFDAAGAPVAAGRFPPGTTAAAVSLEARAAAAYDRNSARLTVLDLPAAATP